MMIRIKCFQSNRTLSSRRSSMRRAAVVSVTCLMLAGTACDIDEPGNTVGIRAAERAANEYFEATGLPGLSIAVGRESELVWADGFGYADLEQRVPVSTSSKFRIGSVSKSLTAAVIGILVDDGVLDIDKPVRHYLPDFPEKQWPVSVRQLAGHLGGVRHYRGDEFYSTRAFSDVGETLDMFVNDPLEHRPGTKYLYSTYGWTVISAVLERAADQPFRILLQQRLTDPLEMVDTVAEDMRPIIAGRVRYYERSTSGNAVNAPYVDPSLKLAGGGFLSTPSDLVRFGFELLDPKLLRSSTAATLVTPQRTEAGEYTGYGIGFESWTDDLGRIVFGHKGSSVGGRTVLAIWPDESLVIAATANVTDDPGLLAFAFALAEHFVGEAD